jgi:formate C-acetyltransferase
LQAFACFIRRHAEVAESAAQACGDRKRRAELERMAHVCIRLATAPVASFHEALQQVWFIQLFLHAEGGGAAVSFGRFDQYVGPFLERDLADGVLTLAQAEELLACFWLKACEGDESQNFVVGGVDAAGKTAENHLSRFCLKVCRQLRVWQPSVSVRLGPESSDAFWHDAVALAEAGFGMPSFFNDPVVSRALEAAGVPAERARDYGIVGCYEATPQGDTQAYTVNGCLSLPDAFLAFFRQESAADSFPAYLAAWQRFLAGYYNGLLLTFL